MELEKEAVNEFDHVSKGKADEKRTRGRYVFEKKKKDTKKSQSEVRKLKMPDILFKKKGGVVTAWSHEKEKKIWALKKLKQNQWTKVINQLSLSRETKEQVIKIVRFKATTSRRKVKTAIGLSNCPSSWGDWYRF